jgi:hypothetical protein
MELIGAKVDKYLGYLSGIIMIFIWSKINICSRIDWLKQVYIDWVLILTNGLAVSTRLIYLWVGYVSGHISGHVIYKGDRGDDSCCILVVFSTAPPFRSTVRGWPSKRNLSLWHSLC